MSYVSPGDAQYLSDLPPAMARGLVRCHALVVLVSADVRSAGVHRQTLGALQRHGLVDQIRDARMRLVWRPTSRGAALIAREEPRLLAIRGDYTTRTAYAVVDEPEAVDALSLKRITERAGMEAEQWRALEQANRERMELHERLADAQRAARNAGVDIRRQEASILRRIEALEAKVRKLAA